MPDIPLNAAEVLERYFLEARAKLLEVAATLDRIDRANGADQLNDDRRRQLDGAIAILQETKPGRAERVQQHFSRPYPADWMREHGFK